MSDTQVPPGPPADPPDNDDLDNRLVGYALDEVQLLIDFISGRPDKNLSSLELLNPVDRNKKIFADEIIRNIAAIRLRNQTGLPIDHADLSFVLLVKDALSRLSSPARSLTIAYTQMFVASALRKRFGQSFTRLLHFVIRRKGRDQGDADSYIGLAIRAFPTLQGHARRSHFWYLIWLCATIFYIIFAAGVYWDVSFGNSILGRVSSLNEERLKILQNNKDAESACRDKSQVHVTAVAPSLEFASVENTPAPLCATNEPAKNTCEAAPVCPPPRRVVHHIRPASTQTIIVECTPSQTPAPGPAPGPTPSKVDPPPCARLLAIDEDKHRAHEELLQLVRCQGGSCSVPLHVLPWSLVIDDGFLGLYLPTAPFHFFFIPSPITKTAETSQAAAIEEPVSFVQIDAIDNSVASLFKIYSTYILPLVFGVLGTLIGAIRDIRNKIKEAELSPRDVWMFAIGLPMGAVAGLVVGLFLSPSDITIPGMSVMSGKLSLSATALGFLAGYGSESFFSFVDAVFKQLFRMTKA